MHHTAQNIAVLLLAAGASRRMGGIKQLLPYKDSTLLGHAIEQAKKVADHVFVVLGANSDKIGDTVPDDVNIVHNPQWENGMGSSISIGMKALNILNKFSAVLIMLADQPLIEEAYLTKLKKNFLENPHFIVATQYENRNGVPAIFDRTLFAELEQLNADFGARKLMEKQANVLKSLDAEGKAIDIDTPESYKMLMTKTKY